MRTSQIIGISTIVPLLTFAVAHTAINCPNNKIETKNISNTNKDIFELYQNAKADYSKGLISTDSLQNIQKRFDEEMKYVECGD